jgi:hypothetical protein
VDFVVAGFGLGAVAVLLGFAIMDLGPLLRRGRSADSTSYQAWIALCREIGNALVLGGVAVCLSTVAALALGLSDANGTRLVLGVGLVALLGAIAWSANAARKFRLAEINRYWGEYGDYSPRSDYAVESRQTANEASPIVFTESAPEEAAEAPAEESVEPVLEEPEEVVTIAAEAEEEVAEVLPVEAPAPSFVPIAAEVEPAEDIVLAEVPVEEPESEPEPVEIEPFPDPVEEPRRSPGQSIFQSPLLADLGAGDQPVENGGGFRSKLFADLEPREIEGPEKRGYSSWILADLGSDAEKEQLNGNSHQDDDSLPLWSPRSSAPGEDDEPVENGSSDRAIERRNRRPSRFDRRS